MIFDTDALVQIRESGFIGRMKFRQHATANLPNQPQAEMQTAASHRSICERFSTTGLHLHSAISSRKLHSTTLSHHADS